MNETQAILFGTGEYYFLMGLFLMLGAVIEIIAEYFQEKKENKKNNGVVSYADFDD